MELYAPTCSCPPCAHQCKDGQSSVIHSFVCDTLVLLHNLLSLCLRYYPGPSLNNGFVKCDFVKIFQNSAKIATLAIVFDCLCCGMLRSLAAASLRCLGLSKYGHIHVRIVASPAPSWCNIHARSYCKDNKEPGQTVVDKQAIIRNIPHTVIDADADLQVDLASELNLQLPITLEPRKYIEFDCAVCDTRIKKTCSTHSYEKGLYMYCTVANLRVLMDDIRCRIDKVPRM